MRKRAFVLAAVIAAAMSHTGYAAYQTETEVTNRVGIGDISIGLEEYELNADGEEIPYENDKTVLPGQRIDKIVRITNHADSVWVRAKLEYFSKDGMEGLSDEMISLASDRWVQAGGYYYYILPVEKAGSIDFIHAVSIPPGWDSSAAGKQFSIIVTAEAVQKDHFTPDFHTQDPWFGTVIETCIHTSYDPASAVHQDFSVVFEGGAEGLVKTGEDFFSNWGDLMPGDTMTDTVAVKNMYQQTVTIYFHTETIAEDRLLENLHLEIRDREKIIYSGALKGAIEEKIALCRLRKGEESLLTYTLHVPAELNNQYARNQTSTKWIFSAGLNGSGGGGGGGGSKGGSSRGGEPGTAGSNPSAYEEAWPAEPEEPGIASPSGLAAAGDGGHPGLLILAMTASAIGFAAVNLKRTEKEEGTDHEE